MAPTVLQVNNLVRQISINIEKYGPLIVRQIQQNKHSCLLYYYNLTQQISTYVLQYKYGKFSVHPLSQQSHVLHTTMETYTLRKKVLQSTFFGASDCPSLGSSQCQNLEGPISTWKDQIGILWSRWITIFLLWFFQVQWNLTIKTTYGTS